LIARRLLFPEVGCVEWESFELPGEPGPYTLVAEALCSLISIGTELALYTGSHIGFTLPDPPFPMMPQRPGYAFVGRIAAMGSKVIGYRVGQRVLIEAPHGTAAVVDVRYTSVVPLPDEISMAAGTLVRMAGIALTAVRVAPVELGDSVAVIGLGLVGLLATQLYRLNGALPVIGIDRLPSRLQVAQDHGAVALCATGAELPGEVALITQGRGADVVVEATGSPAVISLCLELAARGGRVVLLGSTRGLAEVDVYSHVHRKGVHLIGAHESVVQPDLTPAVRWTKARNLELLASLFARGMLTSQGLITHTIRPGELLSIYGALTASPQDYLGVLVDWQE
jgi:2-desacetyl-2-hydroxyethyl bacteriochlorophyllide A dehydrogenase